MWSLPFLTTLLLQAQCPFLAQAFLALLPIQTTGRQLRLDLPQRATSTSIFATTLPTGTVMTSYLLKDLRARTSSGKLNLETDFYDASTGLHSEGVWHNAMAGIASLQVGETEHATRIADSLYEYSWDGVSFQRRAYSGKWDHSTPENEQQPHQAPYYKASSEHRCVQHGIAVVFWSMLVDEGAQYQRQFQEISESFLAQFWNDPFWSTVSAIQGGGTLLRPAASSGRITEGATSQSLYYRAVDQAVAMLACAGITNVWRKHGKDTSEMAQLIQTTRHSLLSSMHGFGYESDDVTRSYIGLDRNRNFWHDGWVLLALISARRVAWPNDPDHGQDELQSIYSRLLGRYAVEGAEGTVWHWARSQKKNSENVRYCGDNALLFAISRSLGGESSISFWEFIDELCKDGMASVADAYPQIRLHPNTELAALLVWPSLMVE